MLIALFLLLSLAASAEMIEGRVIKVSDGDNHIGVVDGGSWRLLCSLSAQDRARFDAWLPAAGLNAVTQAKM